MAASDTMLPVINVSTVINISGDRLLRALVV